MSVTNNVPRLEELLPTFTSVRTDKDGVSLVTRLRTGYVASGRPAKYRVHADYPKDNPKKWELGRGQHPQTSGNDVEYLIDGDATFAAMLEAFVTATDEDHLILVLGWSFGVDFVMTRSARAPYSGPATFKQVIEDRLKNHKCQIRILAFDNPLGPKYMPGITLWGLRDLENDPAYGKRLVTMADGATRVQVSPPTTGAHHQKVVIVKGSQGVIAFWGGIDIFPDRVVPDPKEGVLHDDHARVIGPAADALMEIALARWNHAANLAGMAVHAMGVPPSIVRGKDYPPMGSADTVLEDADSWKGGASKIRWPGYAVQFGQTIGNPELAKKMSSDAWQAVRHLLSSAKRLIYIEDQYCWSLPVADELAAAATRGVTVMMLLPPHADDTTGRKGAAGPDLRLKALARLWQQASGAEDKLHVFELMSPTHFYVHAKSGIVDDEVFWVGSMNLNNRGTFHDSETIGTVADVPWTDSAGPRWGNFDAPVVNLARSYRIQLWAHHLAAHNEDVYDGLASIWRWYTSTFVRSYHIDGKRWKDVVRKHPAVDGTPVSTSTDPLP